jgi:4-hydroxybenzoyl-CoA thioesterase
VPFSTSITVAFGDTDPAALVYYPNLFHYCHIAMERFFSEHCRVPYHRLVTQSRIGFPTVKIDAQFTKPFVYGDEIEVMINVANVSRRSVTLSYRLVRATDTVQCAQVTMVHVAMDLDSRSSVAIPDALRAPLEDPKVSM